MRGAAAVASSRQAPPPGRPCSAHPPFTPSDQALEPWVPGSRKIHLEDAELESPGRLGGLAPGSLPPGALSAAGMWVAAGGSEAAVGAAWGFFFFFLNLALTSSLFEQGSAWRSPEMPVLWSDFERPSFGASGCQELLFELFDKFEVCAGSRMRLSSGGFCF